MTVENLGDGGFAVTGKDIETFRLIALQKALKLEVIGLKSRGKPAQIVRDILKANNWEAPRNKQKLLNYYTYFLTERGIPVTNYIQPQP